MKNREERRGLHLFKGKSLLSAKRKKRNSENISKKDGSFYQGIDIDGIKLFVKMSKKRD